MTVLNAQQEAIMPDDTITQQAPPAPRQGPGGDLASFQSDVRTDIATLKEQSARYQADIHELKRDVAILKEDVAVLKTDVAHLKEDVAELKQNVKELKQDIAEIKADVAQIRLDIAELRTELHKELRRQMYIFCGLTLTLVGMFVAWTWRITATLAN